LSLYKGTGLTLSVGRIRFVVTALAGKPAEAVTTNLQAFPDLGIDTHLIDRAEADPANVIDLTTVDAFLCFASAKVYDKKQRPNLILLPLLPLVGMAWILNKLGQSNYLVKGFAGFMNSPKQKRKAFAGYEPSANVLLLIYGQMKQNPQAIIKQIAVWMGVILTPAQLEKVVEKR
jgi:hypothetical protein